MNPAAGQQKIPLKSGGLSNHEKTYALIFTNTPAGTTRRLSASTVRAVGSKISITRLCVRISNCSRLFLSMCGLRRTVYRSIRVGTGIGPQTRALVRLALSTISFSRGIERTMIVRFHSNSNSGLIRCHRYQPSCQPCVFRRNSPKSMGRKNNSPPRGERERLASEEVLSRNGRRIFQNCACNVYWTKLSAGR